MAKKIGAKETPAKTTAPKPAPASVEDTNVVVTQKSFLEAVGEIEAQAAKVKAENEKLKSLKLKWKSTGIAVTILNAVVTLAKQSRGDLRDHFETTRKYAGWLNLPIDGRDNKNWEGLSDDQIQRKEWFALGRTYSRTGRVGRPPDECPPEFHQAFMRGFNEEDEAAWADSESERVPGGDVDAGGGQAPGSDDAGQAADAEPAPAVVVGLDDQPSWVGFGEEPDDWFADHKRIFAKWFEALPANATVRISHGGVLKAFRAARDAERATLSEGEPDETPKIEGEEEAEPAALAAAGPTDQEGPIEGHGKPVVH